MDSERKHLKLNKTLRNSGPMIKSTTNHVYSITRKVRMDSERMHLKLNKTLRNSGPMIKSTTNHVYSITRKVRMDSERMHLKLNKTLRNSGPMIKSTTNHVYSITRKVRMDSERMHLKLNKTLRNSGPMIKSTTKYTYGISHLQTGSLDEKGTNVPTKTDNGKAEVPSDYFTSVLTGEDEHLPTVEHGKYRYTLSSINFCQTCGINKNIYKYHKMCWARQHSS